MRCLNTMIIWLNFVLFIEFFNEANEVNPTAAVLSHRLFLSVPILCYFCKMEVVEEVIFMLSWKVITRDDEVEFLKQLTLSNSVDS